jgi:glycosyltransferase involved in cell wall biosynthesis
MQISLIIPAFNEEAYIGQCLKSVLENRPANLLEIIVVNNASTDRTTQVTASFHSVRVVEENKKGLTRARQAGLIAAKGDLLVYIDADTLVRKEWFEILNSEFEKDQALVCLSGPYRYFGLPEQISFVSKLWYKLWFKVWYGFANFFVNFTRGYVVIGGNFAVKKQVMLNIGGFDTKIEFYGEDTDIARRLNKAGKIKFLKAFWLASSARRFNQEGLVVTGFRYLLNYLSVIVLKKPTTKKYSDIR